MIGKETQWDEIHGCALALLRLVCGWGQRLLARKAGLKETAVSEYESGKKAPDYRTLRKMLDAMGFDLADFEEALGLVRRLRARRLTRLSQESPKSSDLLNFEVGALLRDLAELTANFNRATMQYHQGLGGLFAKALMATRAGRSLPRSSSEAPDHEEPSTPPEQLWEPLRHLPFDRLEAHIARSADLRSWQFCELLCNESVAASAAQPVRALELARLAVQAAEGARLDPPRKAKLRGYARAHLSNSQRVLSDLQAAKEDFAEAERAWEEGATGAPDFLSEARLLDLKASLRRSQRLLPEALDLLARALATPGGERFRGHILINKSKTLEELGRLPEAVGVLTEAEAFIDPQTDPRLAFTLRHNRLDYLTKLGRFEEAKKALPAVQAAARKLGCAMHSLRLRWIEARLAAGLGESDRAVTAYLQVRAGFIDRGIGYDAALVSLELATFYLREGRTGEVKALARHMVPIFRAQDIHREALAAITLFRQAAEQEAITLDFTERVLAYLHQARNEPSLVFQGNG